MIGHLQDIRFKCTDFFRNPPVRAIALPEIIFGRIRNQKRLAKKFDLLEFRVQAERYLNNGPLINIVSNNSITVPVDRHIIFPHLDLETDLADDHVWVKSFLTE